MKICTNCGAQQSDDRNTCIDCDTQLGKALTPEEEAAVRSANDKNLSKLFNRTDPLYVGLYDRIIGFASLSGIAASILIAILRPRFIAGVLGSVIFFAVSAVTALLPRLLWSITQFNLSWYYSGTDNLEPSEQYGINRKIAMTAFFVLSCILIGICIYSWYDPIPAFI